jgi:hypothetical protein
MRFTNTLLPLVAAAFVLGCDDPGSAPAAVDSPLFNAGQGPDNKMELIWAFPYPEEVGFPDYFPCFNGGEGENVIAFGLIEFWARTVETPSGNVMQHGELRGYENYRGQDTGDLWLSSAITVPTVFYNTRDSDGYTTINEPVWNYAENQRTGEVVRLMWRYHQVIDAEGGFVRADVKLTNCKPWKGQVK